MYEWVTRTKSKKIEKYKDFFDMIFFRFFGLNPRKMGILGPNLIFNQLSKCVMIPDVKNRVSHFQFF